MLPSMNFFINKKRNLHFTLGNNEYGEAFHVMAAYELQFKSNYNVSYTILNSTQISEFFKDLFNSNGLAYKNSDHLALTSHIIRDCFYDGCLKRIRNLIEDLAKEEDWENQLKEEENFKKHCNGIINDDKKVIYFIRNRDDYNSHRNTSIFEIEAIQEFAKENHFEIIYISKFSEDDDIYNKYVKQSGFNLNKYYNWNFFKKHSIAKQLWFLNWLFEKCGAKVSLGMMSGAMDGLPMVYGRKTIFFGRHEDVVPRMKRVSDSVPNLIWLQTEFSENSKSINGELLKNNLKKLIILK